MLCCMLKLKQYILYYVHFIPFLKSCIYYWYVCVCVCTVCWSGCAQCGGQRATLWSQFCLSTTMKVPGIELRSPGLHINRLYPLRLLTKPILFKYNFYIWKWWLLLFRKYWVLSDRSHSEKAVCHVIARVSYKKNRTMEMLERSVVARSQWGVQSIFRAENFHVIL